MPHGLTGVTVVSHSTEHLDEERLLWNRRLLRSAAEQLPQLFYQSVELCSFTRVEVRKNNLTEAVSSFSPWAYLLVSGSDQVHAPPA